MSTFDDASRRCGKVGRFALAFGVVLAALLPPPAARADQDEAALLRLGIRKVEDGDYEEALFTLDRAVQRLSAVPEKKAALCDAYLYFGAAYVGLNNERAARGKFREALARCPQLRPSPQRFPPRVLQVYDTQVLATTAATKKRRTRRWLIAGAAGAASAVGVAVATSGGPMPNRPPQATVDVSSDGTPIVEITPVTLTASASDPDGDALRCEWDLGDGSTASGPSVTHVYRQAGTFKPLLTVNDGRNPAVQVATASVTVSSLTGSWSGWVLDPTTYTLVQQGALFGGPTSSGNNGRAGEMQGRLEAPRRVTARIVFFNPTNRGDDSFEGCTGTVDAQVRKIEIACPPSERWQTHAGVMTFSRQ